MKIRIIFCTLIIVSLLAACSPATSEPENQSNQSTATETIPVDNTPTEIPSASQTSEPNVTGKNFDVEISGFAFVENALTIKAGDSVTWVNHDATSHSVVADDGSFKSGTLANNGTFSFTFTTAGTFSYHCGFHSSMTGTIIVQP